MKAYEFTTVVTPDGKLVIPEPYAGDIPVGDPVRVILLIKEEALSVFSEGVSFSKIPALEKIVDEIRQSPQNPVNVQPASGLLAEHLATPSGSPDPSFDVNKWNQEWDEIEAEMKKLEIVEQDAEEADFNSL
jgi:hypothetical protein